MAANMLITVPSMKGTHAKFHGYHIFTSQRKEFECYHFCVKAFHPKSKRKLTGCYSRTNFKKVSKYTIHLVCVYYMCLLNAEW